MSAESGKLGDECHAAICDLQDLRKHLVNLRSKQWPAKDWDLTGQHVAANIGHAAKVAEWDLPKVDAAIRALSACWEMLEAAPAEDVPSEEVLIAAGLGYPLSKEAAHATWEERGKPEPLTDHPQNQHCKGCLGCGHDQYGYPCAVCVRPAEDVRAVGEEPVYLYRRKGFDSWATCDRKRFDMLAVHNCFEVDTLYRRVNACIDEFERLNK